MSSILFSEMKPAPSWEDEFNHWYDQHHIPVRLCLPGFEDAQRYRSAEDGTYLVVYDMTSLEALKTPGYAQVKDFPNAQTRWMLEHVTGFTRNLGNEIGRHGDMAAAREAGVVFCAFFHVPQESLSEFDGWMVEDHVPLLLQCRQWLAVRRFQLTLAEPGPYNRLAIHYLADPSALTSTERQQARETPWRARLAAQPWFSTGRYRTFERFGPLHLPTQG